MQRELMRAVYPSLDRVDSREFECDEDKLNAVIEMGLENINRCLNQRESDSLLAGKNRVDKYLEDKKNDILGYKSMLGLGLVQEYAITDVVESIEDILIHLDVIDKENRIHNYWLDISNSLSEPLQEIYSVDSIIVEIEHTFKLLSVCANSSKEMVQQLSDTEQTLSLAEEVWCNSETRSEREKELELLDYFEASSNYEYAMKVLIDTVEIQDKDVKSILRLYDDIQAVYKGKEDFRVTDILSSQRLLIGERVLRLSV